MWSSGRNKPGAKAPSPRGIGPFRLFEILYLSALGGSAGAKIFFPLQARGFFPRHFTTAAATVEIILGILLMTRLRRVSALLLVLFFLAAGVFTWAYPGVECGCFGSFRGGRGFHETLVSLMGLGALLLFLERSPSTS